MTSISNVSPFATALSAVVNHTLATDGKQTSVLFPMVNMETTFDRTWIEKFFKAEGSDKTDMIHYVLTENYPGFDSLLETAKEPTKGMTKAQKTDKANAQKKVKAAENVIRSACFALAFFRLKEIETSKIEMVAKKIRYAAKDKAGDYVWHDAATFAELVSLGRKELETVGIVKAKPAANASSGAANSGDSVVATLGKAANTGGAFPNAFAETCKALASLLMVKDVDTLSESEQEALRNLEQAIITRVYADDSGIVDTASLVEQYQNTKSKPKATKKAKNGVTLATSANAEVQAA